MISRPESFGLRVSLVLIASIALVLGVMLYLETQKGRRKLSDDDLLPPRVEIPEKENAVVLLSQAVARLNFSESDGVKLSQFYKTNSDSAQVSSILAANEEALGLWAAAMEMSRLQVPQVRDVEEEFPYLSKWRTFASLAGARVITLSKAGKDKESIELAMSTVKFGHLVEESGGVQTHYLVGSGIKLSGLAGVRFSASRAKLSCPELHEYIERLDRYPASHLGLESSLKEEYRITAKFMESVAGSGNPLFSKSKTKEKYAGNVRAVLKHIRRPYGVGVVRTNIPGGEPSVVRLIMGGNPVGDMMTGLYSTMLPLIEKRKAQENVAVRATQLLLAIKCFQIQNNRLPASLAELVPEFFAEVPIDDFDGKPFRYSAKDKLIYSVGEALLDLGGREHDAKKGRLNISFKIEF